MRRNTRLNDLQLVLLAHGAARDDGQLLPFPASVLDAKRASHECKTLLRRGLIAEAPAPNAAASWREDGDERIGLILTDVGRTAIGVEASWNTSSAHEEPPTPSPTAPKREGSKRMLVIALLQSAAGATLAELVDATGWQPHSARAVLTGLRKLGHAVTKTKRGDVTCYHIAEQA